MPCNFPIHLNEAWDASVTKPPTPLRLDAAPGICEFWVATVNLRFGGYGETRLMHAAELGRQRETVRLLACGADPNIPDVESETALMRAARLGHVPIVNLLIKARAKLERRSNDGWTALHFAAGRNKIGTMQALLRAGAQIEARDNSQRTPLHVAAWNGGMDALRQLLDCGADMTSRSEGGRGRTALAWAARFRRAADSIVNGKRRAMDELRRRGSKDTPDVVYEERECVRQMEKEELMRRNLEFDRDTDDEEQR